jgi:glucosamine--fructose-6-phosphate aminotransferase (isomerizing)
MMLSQNDVSRAGYRGAGKPFRLCGAEVLTAGIEVESALTLPTVAADPALEPMLMIQSFYRMAGRAGVRARLQSPTSRRTSTR